MERTGCLTGYDRVAPVVKEQIDSGKINLTAIMNTHQYGWSGIGAKNRADAG